MRKRIEPTLVSLDSVIGSLTVGLRSTRNPGNGPTRNWKSTTG
jgi:hypothetical protein